MNTNKQRVDEVELRAAWSEVLNLVSDTGCSLGCSQLDDLADEIERADRLPSNLTPRGLADVLRELRYRREEHIRLRDRYEPPRILSPRRRSRSDA